MTERQAFRHMVLTVRGLTGRRGDKLLFEGLDFAVQSGQALTLRGPNGAGKTTLLLTLAGMIRPTAGTLDISGADDDGAPLLHYFGHQNAIKPRLSVAENLSFWAAVNGSTGIAPRIALDEVGLGAIATLDAGYLSAGQSRRLALARLLVTARPVWLLDEPMAALDSTGDALVGRLVDQHLDLGGMVITATHDDLPLRHAARISLLTLGEAS